MKKRVAVLGTGMRATFFLDTLMRRDDSELSALCDLYPTRMAVAARQIGMPDVPQFSDIRDCLASVEFDALINCSADSTHAETTIPALAEGKFVFLEKPLDVTREKCAAIVEADKAAGGKTYVGLNLRHAPLYRKIKELIDADVLGRILTIQADEFYHGGRTYFRRWNRLRKFGGGLWITKASHDFDLLQWFAGGKPVSVAAFSHLTYYRPDSRYPRYCKDCPINNTCPDVFSEETSSERWLELVRAAVENGMERPDLCLFNSDKDTIDHGVATVNFDNEVVATYALNVVAGFTNRTIRISGTKAAVEGDLESQEITIRYINPLRSETIKVTESQSSHGGADEHLIPDFFAFMDGKKKPMVTPDEAMVSVLLGLAATKSSDTGEVVKLTLA